MNIRLRSNCLTVRVQLQSLKFQIARLFGVRRFWTFKQLYRVWFTLKHIVGMKRTYSQKQDTDKCSQHSAVIWPVRLNGWVFVYEISGCGFESSYGHLNFRLRTCCEEGIPWHLLNYIECGFTLKYVRDMTKKHSEMHHLGKYSQPSSIIWPVGLNVWVSVYELRVVGSSPVAVTIFQISSLLQARSSLTFRQLYRAWIDCETHTWHDKNIQSNALYR